MEKKSLYREYYPGYMGHIPYKFEVIGSTVGATNKQIKSLLSREPDYEETFVPSKMPDYTYYNKGYFNENMSKNYPLEEDKIFSNRSKEARTWICGPKHVLYPEHIPGYTGHVTSIESNLKKGSNIFGTSYAKASSIAIKGDYCNKTDLPIDERYKSEMKDKFIKPKIRSEEEEKELQKVEAERHPQQSYIPQTKEEEEMTKGLSDNFKNAVFMKRKKAEDVPYVLHYGGFRPGVQAASFYGKNFTAESKMSQQRIQEMQL